MTELKEAGGVRKLIPGYYPEFNYGGPIGHADEDDTVNGRPPYLPTPTNFLATFQQGRGAQIIQHPMTN